MSKKMLRQGDLLFILEEGTEEPGAKEIHDGILVRGEATNHAHRIAVNDLDKVSVRQGTHLRLVVNQETRIIHEEHGSVVLTPGQWTVVRQREWNSGMIRTVVD